MKEITKPVHGKKTAAAAEEQSPKKQNLVISFLWIIIIFLLFLFSSQNYFRLDVTKNRSNTLSRFSRELCRGIDGPLIITYFVSERLLQSSPLPGEITDILDEYAAASGGMIRVIQKDPQKTDLSYRFSELGIFPEQIISEENNESTMAAVYNSILIEYLDRFEVLPWVSSSETLEFNLGSRILSLTGETEWNLGIIADNGEWERKYTILNGELRSAGFTVRNLRPGEEIPPNIKSIFVLAGAETLDETALRRIDRFIGSGGSALFAADAVSVDYEKDFSVRPLSGEGLFAALAAYGVVLEPFLVLEETGLPLSYGIQNPNGTTETKTIRYPEWINLSPQNANQNHPLSSDFSGPDLYWASPLELHPPLGVEAAPLFSSGKDAWLQTKDFAVLPDLLSFFENEKEETRGTKILISALEGFFPSPFLESRAFSPAPEVPPGKPDARAASRLIVIGDTDFAGDLMGAAGAGRRNLDFLIKAALWLGKNDGLVKLKNRAEGNGRLDRINESGEKNSAMNFSLLFNVFFLPAMVIIAGIIIIRAGFRPGLHEGARR